MEPKPEQLKSKHVSIPDMLRKLDELYDKEEKLKKEYAQLRDDIALLENMIMYASNKNVRRKQ